MNDRDNRNPDAGRSGPRKSTGPSGRPYGGQRQAGREGYRSNDRPAGSYRGNDKPAGQYRSDDRPAAQSRSGDRPAGQFRSDDRPAGQSRSGDRPAGGQYRSSGRPSERPPARRAGGDFKPAGSTRRFATAPKPAPAPKFAPAPKPTPAPKPVAPPAPSYPEIEAGAGLPDRLEGRNPILEAIKAGRAINKLWVAKREGKPDPGFGHLVSLARDAGAVIMEVDRKVLDAMSTTHGHQGVIAQVAAHEYIEIDDLVKSAKEKSDAPFFLALAELQESYNLGSILRIADAAGADGVIIPTRRSVGLDAAVAKASAGAIEHVPVARVGNLAQTIAELKQEGFWIAGTDADGKTDYRSADWKGPLVIVIGSEGEGLSPLLKKQCDFLVSIPMHGRVNSLNAAVAAGIVTFEAAARRHGIKQE